MVAQEDLFESLCILIEDNVHLNMKNYIQPNFHAMVVKEVVGLLTHTFNQAHITDDELMGEAWLLSEAERAMAVFYKHILPPRQSGATFIRVKPNITKLQEKITYLQQVPQPEQRTTAWYEFRYKHLTASNIWKVFISESTRNQLIYEKCQPLNTEKFGNVSMESPMHWGQKYEPVSIMLYEHIYKAPVSDFGCIPHKTLDFLAASPDGIVTAETSLRYGRMLEVKNIVNREITGIPKMEYWVQMQVQMEVCELNECDFLETRFVEYADKDAFTDDILTKYKGMMMLFMLGNGKPVYEYAPLSGDIDIDTWQEEMMEKNSELSWMKNIYWKLDQLSCVLVLRNKAWFAAAVPQLKEFWTTIETDKKNGYKHREPKKSGVRVKKLNTSICDDIEMKAQCFINIST